MRRLETGAKIYQLVRSRKTSGTYRVMELFEDQAALDRHHESRHYAEARDATQALLARAPSMHIYDVPA